VRVQRSNDGSVIYKLVLSDGTSSTTYFIKFASAKCKKAKQSLRGEAKAYHSLPPAVVTDFVPVAGYFVCQEGDYLVTVAPAKTGWKYYSPSSFFSTHPGVGLVIVFNAIYEVLQRMSENDFAHEDLHTGNFLIGFNEATKEVRIVLLDPGCWDLRELSNPYLSICDAYLKKSCLRTLQSFSVSSLLLLRQMLDVVPPLAGVSRLKISDDGMTRMNGEYFAVVKSLCQFIEKKFNWKLEIDLSEWDHDWSLELARSVCTYLHELEPASPSSDGMPAPFRLADLGH
jgi:hypothetical protein